MRFGVFRHTQPTFLRHPTKFRPNRRSGDQFYNDSSYQSYPQNTVESLTMNVETLSGRAELAQLLQSLQQTLKNI